MRIGGNNCSVLAKWIADCVNDAIEAQGNDTNIIVQTAVGNSGEVVDDTGDRNVVNGRSFTSSASPGLGSSVWDGHEDSAFDKNVTVEDRSISAPFPQYVVDSAGNWSQSA